MDLKDSQYLEKLIIEDGEVMVIFTFPNDERKIRCSRALLCEVSEVFKTMFGTKWDSGNGNSTVELTDLVPFNQFETFKLFVQLLYGMRQIESLSGVDACHVFFYSDKYDVRSVSKKILAWITSQLQHKVTLNELESYIEIAETYPVLDDFAKKLGSAKLDLNERDAMKFFALVKESGMCLLQQQIADYLKTIPPRSDWSNEVLQSIIKDLQIENNHWKAESKTWIGNRLQLKEPTQLKERTMNNCLTKGKNITRTALRAMVKKQELDKTN